jgi:thiosulfate reductase cytochrome b subunit
MSPRNASAPRHPVIVRVTHWTSAVALTVMAASGLRIFNAHPSFARPGDPPFPLWPFEGMTIPAWLTFGGWLGGARHWHFAMMWLLVANALVYLGHLARHGRWRTLVPLRGDWRDAIAMARFYLRRRDDHPAQGRHNALQKQAYTAMLACGALLVLTGLSIWKPVTFGALTALFGGYTWARWWHFATMLALAVLVLGHVAMVLLVDPYALRAMTTGGYDAARWSPTARNARPFQGWLPARDPHDDAHDAPIAPATEGA